MKRDYRASIGRIKKEIANEVISIMNAHDGLPVYFNRLRGEAPVVTPIISADSVPRVRFYADSLILRYNKTSRRHWVEVVMTSNWVDGWNNFESLPVDSMVDILAALEKGGDELFRR